jgi:hypothetical protein
MTRPNKREALLLALLCSPNLKAAAAKAGISYATAKRYTAADDFQKELAEAKATAFGQALTVLQGCSARAAKTLLRNLKADKASDRTQAAKTLLDFAFRAWEDNELTERVKELEALVQELVKK